jgi:hypothetical protein
MDAQQVMEILLAKMETYQAKLDADREERKAWREEFRAETEVIRTRTKAMQDERMKANIDACQETTACQDAMEANIVEMEPTPGEKEAAVERQETPNEDIAIYSLRECRKETMACQGTTEARLECEKPTPVDMESESKHRRSL